MKEKKKFIHLDVSGRSINLYEVYQKLCNEGVIKNKNNKSVNEYSNEYKGLIGKVIEKGLWK